MSDAHAHEVSTARTAPLFVPLLHGLRGFAVLAVVAIHLLLVGHGTHWLPAEAVPRAFFQTGFLAVDTLFLIGGFVLFLPVLLKGEFGSVGSFAIRRLSRLVPAYWVCLLVILVLFPLLTPDNHAGLAPHGPLAWLAHFGLVHREVLGNQVGLGVDGPVWVLSIDALFYVVLPLVAIRYARHPFLWLAGAIALSVGWRIAFPGPSYHGFIQFPLFAANFGIGMTTAWIFVRVRRDERLLKRARRLAPALYAGGALVVASLAYWIGSGLGHKPLVQTVFDGPPALSVAIILAAGVFVFGGALAPAWSQWPFTNSAAQWLGELSYSVYLYHLLAIEFAINTLGFGQGSGADVLKLAAFTIPTTAVVAAASYFWVERPARRIGRRLAGRLTGQARGRDPQPAPSAAKAL